MPEKVPPQQNQDTEHSGNVLPLPPLSELEQDVVDSTDGAKNLSSVLAEFQAHHENEEQFGDPETNLPDDEREPDDLTPLYR